MKLLRLTFLVLISFGLEACQSFEEKDINFLFLGHAVNLPMTVEEAVSLYKVKIDSSNNWRLINNLNSEGIEIQVMPRRVGKDSPNEKNRSVYAISFITNTSLSIDQIKVLLERKFRKTFVQKITNPTLYSTPKNYQLLEINSSNEIVIEFFSNRNKINNSYVKTSFCHELSRKERNLFISREGIIWEDD